MSRAGPIVTAISGGLLLLGIILSVVGAGSVATVEFTDMESNFLEAGTSTIELDGEYLYSVYLSPGSTCDGGFSLQIENSQSGATFDAYCDEYWDTTDGYVFVGDLDPQPEIGEGWSTQTLTLTANQDSYVANDMSAYESAGLTMLGGSGICCLGLIGLIVGIIMWISMGGNNNHAQQVGFVQAPVGGMQQSFCCRDCSHWYAKLQPNASTRNDGTTKRIWATNAPTTTRCEPTTTITTCSTKSRI